MPVLVSTSRSGLKNGKRYNNFTNIRLTEISFAETNDSEDANRSNLVSESEPRLLTQETVKEQKKNYIVLSTKQLGDQPSVDTRDVACSSGDFSTKTKTTAGFTGTGTSFDTCKSPQSILQTQYGQ